MKRWLVTLGLIGLVLAAVMIGAGYLSTTSAVGHFAPVLKVVPAQYGLRTEEVSFSSQDGINLKGWWIPAQGTFPLPQHRALGTVILAHGNGGNRSYMLSRAAFLALNGYNAFPIDLRAHGQSGGTCMTPGYLEALDILGAVTAVQRRGDSGPFIVLGHSYGARAALWATAQSNDVSAAIADGAFVSIYETLSRAAANARSDPTASFGEKFGLQMSDTLAHTSWARVFMESAYYWRTGVRLTPRFEDVTPAVSQIGSRPILFIVGEKDVIAPPEDSRHLYDVAQSPLKAIWIVDGADHNSTFSTNPDLYKLRVLKFLRTARGG